MTEVREKFWVILIVLAVVGCQAPPPAPVAERPQPPTQKILVHRVSSGETLYSIAWRYELDFSRLAAVNGLASPYRLYSGQMLSLDMSQPVPAPVRKNTGRTAVTAKPIPSLAKVEPERPPKVVIPQQPPLPTGQWHWRWPVTGRVVKEYDVSKVQKGISIYTSEGATVAAAAPGVVVYAGSGLRGYGNLIIVKHSEKYLSAYAHNKLLLVKENESVAQGDKIAKVGKDSAKHDRLYFEIRKNGKPVDPLKLLPAL